MRSCRGPWVVAVAIALSVLVPGTARATFHLMEISEVLVGYGGDCRIQYVELRMLSRLQTLVGGQSLFFFDAEGEPLGSFRIPANVSNGDLGAHILIGTPEFAKASTVAPDFVMPEGLLRPHGGRVSFAGSSPAAAVDSVAYGIFSADNGPHGAPAPRLSAVDGLSLTRVGGGADNGASFERRDPSPANNAGDSGSLSLPPGECFFTDPFEDTSNWDVPEPNAGLAFGNCVPELGLVDIGTVEAANGRLLLRPGLSPVLGFPVPLVFTGMTTEAAAMFVNEERYRLQFDVLAQEGILLGAVFANQHYLFDDASGTINVGPETQAGGMGFNFSFDCPHDFDGTCDHLHPDRRSVCLTEAPVEGPEDADFPDGLTLSSNTPYTLILDVDGDDVAGPFLLQVKFFPAAEEEPQDYLATWKAPEGLDVFEDEEFDHGLLIAALGMSGAALEVSNLSACEIPRRNLFVKCLTCTTTGDGDVVVEWQNPLSDDGPIDIVVNGAHVETLPGTATTTVIEGPISEDLTVEVINASCVPATCDVCFNGPPDAAIEGPEKAFVDDEGNATVRLDGGASEDGDGGTQELFPLWEVVSTPPGATAKILLLDESGLLVDVMVDMEGAYEIRLTVTDSGCPGTFDAASDEAIHGFFISHVDPFFFRRGDSDATGVLELTDAIHLLNFLFLGGPAPECPDASDADDNGVLELTDAIRVLGFLFLGGPPPAAPGPAQCGDDPSPDDLAGCIYDC